MKKEELIEDYLVYTDNGIEKVHWCNVNGVKELVSPKGKVYGYVPDYFEVKRLQEQLDIAKTGIEFVKDVLVENKDSDVLWDMVNGYLKTTLDKIKEVK